MKSKKPSEKLMKKTNIPRDVFNTHQKAGETLLENSEAWKQA
jgi:hypothetical protein